MPKVRRGALGIVYRYTSRAVTSNLLPAQSKNQARRRTKSGGITDDPVKNTRCHPQQGRVHCQRLSASIKTRFDEGVRGRRHAKAKIRHVAALPCLPCIEQAWPRNLPRPTHAVPRRKSTTTRQEIELVESQHGEINCICLRLDSLVQCRCRGCPHLSSPVIRPTNNVQNAETRYGPSLNLLR